MHPTTHRVLLRNERLAWIGMAVGIGMGLLMGLWSFGGPVPVPEVLGGYDALARRLLRLGHIAFFGLGFLNLSLVGQIRRWKPSGGWARGLLNAMALGNIGLPLLLVAAAFAEPLKYLLPLPALCVAAAVFGAAYLAVKPKETEQ